MHILHIYNLNVYSSCLHLATDEKRSKRKIPKTRDLFMTFSISPDSSFVRYLGNEASNLCIDQNCHVLCRAVWMFRYCTSLASSILSKLWMQFTNLGVVMVVSPALDTTGDDFIDLCCSWFLFSNQNTI